MGTHYEAAADLANLAIPDDRTIVAHTEQLLALDARARRAASRAWGANALRAIALITTERERLETLATKARAARSEFEKHAAQYPAIRARLDAANAAISEGTLDAKIAFERHAELVAAEQAHTFTARGMLAAHAVAAGALGQASSASFLARARAAKETVRGILAHHASTSVVETSRTHAIAALIANTRPDELGLLVIELDAEIERLRTAEIAASKLSRGRRDPARTTADLEVILEQTFAAVARTDVAASVQGSRP